jgi:hypothetical protein
MPVLVDEGNTVIGLLQMTAYVTETRLTKESAYCIKKVIHHVD